MPRTREGRAGSHLTYLSQMEFFKYRGVVVRERQLFSGNEAFDTVVQPHYATTNYTFPLKQFHNKTGILFILLTEVPMSSLSTFQTHD